MSDVDPTINGVGGEGFAVDGTDSFAVDPELPPDEPAAGPAPHRRGLFLTVATGLVLLLVVVIAGSAGGDDQAGLRGEDVTTTEPARSTTTTEATDDTDPEPDTEQSGAVSGDDLRSPSEAASEFDDQSTEDTFDDFDDFDEFDDDFTVDDFDLSEYEDEFDDFSDDDFSGSGGGRYLPRRVPYVPSTRRPTPAVPPWYRPPTTDPEDTEPEDTEPEDETTTTVATTVATTAATTVATTAATTAPTTVATTTTIPVPPGPWANAASELPVDCTEGLRLWARGGGLVASVPGSGLYNLPTSGTGDWSPLAGSVGTSPHRAFAPDSLDGGRFWIVDSAGTLHAFANGSAAPVPDAPAEVRSLSVHIASAGAEPTILVAAGDPTPTLRRLVSGSTTWDDVSALPAGAGTIRHVLLVDAVTLLVGTDQGVYRRQGAGEWTREHTDPVFGEPVVSDGTISWLVGGVAGVDGVIQSSNGGQDWVERPASVLPAASRVAALPGGRVVTVGAGDTLLASPVAGQSTWTAFGPTMTHPSAEVAGVVRVANHAATYVWTDTCGADSVMRLPD